MRDELRGVAALSLLVTLILTFPLTSTASTGNGSYTPAGHLGQQSSFNLTSKDSIMTARPVSAGSNISTYKFETATPGSKLEAPSVAPRIETVVNLTTFSQPSAVSVDSSGEAFIAQSRTDSVVVVSESSGAVISNVNVGSDPEDLLYDPGTNEIFVSNHLSNNLTVISASSFKILTTISLGSATTEAGPTSLAYDGSRGEIFVADSDTSNISVVSDLNNSVIHTIDMGVLNTPQAILYDSGRQEIVELDSTPAGTNLTFVSASTYTIEGQFVLPGATSIAYDSASSEILASTANSENVTVISDSSYSFSRTISLSDVPTVLEYDSGTGDLYSASSGGPGVLQTAPAASGSPITTIALSGDPLSRYAMTYDPETALVIVPVQNSSTGDAFLDIIADGSPTFPVQFVEQGLPAGTAWGVSLDGVNHRASSSTILVEELNGSFQYVIDLLTYWAPTGNSTGQVVVNGSPVDVSIIWNRIAWSVSFASQGLPSKTSWSVTLNGTLNGSQASTIGFAVPNGSYPYTVTEEAGWRITPANGVVSVNGQNVSVIISWTRLTYLVTFVEKGLPSGTTWTVTAAEANNSSSGPSVSFYLSNGSAQYSIHGIPGWRATPTQGTVRVSGQPINVNISWNLTLYPLSIIEVGLQLGAGWSASVNGSMRHSTSSMITFNLSNGSYSFLIGLVGGYNSSPMGGTITISGVPATLSVAFSQPASVSPVGGSPSSFLGLPTSGGYILLGGILVVVLVFAVVARWIYRRARKSGARPIKPEPCDDNRIR